LQQNRYASGNGLPTPARHGQNEQAKAVDRRRRDSGVLKSRPARAVIHRIAEPVGWALLTVALIGGFWLWRYYKKHEEGLLAKAELGHDAPAHPIIKGRRRLAAAISGGVLSIENPRFNSDIG
jgi:hypothetical protein